MTKEERDMAKVLLDHVWKIYNPGQKTEVEAVKDLSLECKDREFLAILGPSGCGKSSTMRMIAGLEAVSKGNIYIGERLVNDIHPKDRDVAMVFENYALYSHLSVKENITLGLQVRKVPPAEIDRKLKEVVDILDIGGILERRPGPLSGGQKQRVAVARTIAREPAVTIMDEPISHIDAKLRMRVRGEIKRLHTQLGFTTVYVTHNQAEALSLADRVAVMNQGVLQQLGTPLELFDHPANRFVADFVGEPAMNFISCEIGSLNGTIELMGKGMRVSVPEKYRSRLEQAPSEDLVLGIRPMDILPSRLGPDQTTVLSGRIEVVELLGDEEILTVETPSGEIRLLTSAQFGGAPGEPLHLAFDTDRIHLFAQVSGNARI
jgi:multiple sugar transport system ATP-binding protein